MQLVSPASLADVFAHVLARDWRLLPTEYRNLVQAALAGEVHAAREGEAVPAIGGVLRPLPGVPGTCWLSVVPGLSVRQVLTATLLMRRVLRAEAAQGPLVCGVRDLEAKGARLAALLGFGSPRSHGPFVSMSYGG